MQAKLLWSPQAVEDLMEIYVTIGLDNASAAERVYQAIETRSQGLLRFPRMGQRRPEIASTARVLVEGSYLILYELFPDSDDGPTDRIEIVRIVDGRRELSRMF